MAKKQDKPAAPAVRKGKVDRAAQHQRRMAKKGATKVARGTARKLRREAEREQGAAREQAKREVAAQLIA